jgi:hypothetical protein
VLLYARTKPESIRNFIPYAYKKLMQTDEHRFNKERNNEHFALKLITYIMCIQIHSCASSVGIANGYGLGDRRIGVRARLGSTIFTLPRRPDLLGTPPSLLYSGYQGLFLRGAWQQRIEADHSPPPSAEVKKTWVYTSTLPYVFMAWSLIS